MKPLSYGKCNTFTSNANIFGRSYNFDRSNVCHIFFFSAKLTTFRALEVEIRNLNNLLIEKNKLIGRLQETIKTEQDEKMDLVEEQEKFRKETVEQRDLWNQEMSKVRKELENMNEIIAQNERGAEEKLQIRLEEEKMLFINEQDNDR